MRTVAYAREGELGKPTASVATAARSDESGHKTTIPSADSAHGLSDSLDTFLRGAYHLTAPVYWTGDNVFGIL